MLLLSPNFAKVKSFLHKHLCSEDAYIVQWWNQHSGDWHWLQDSPRPIASINRHLWRLSVPSLSFHFLLGVSSIIATLGLFANNVAAIIGAMIIAPLMGPIVGTGYAMIISNRRLLRRSLLTLASGTILTIVTSLLTAYFVGLREIGSEILSRANPTLIDLALAIAAGAAGAFANSRRRIADALPGVAIAVALVPPLSVIGIGLALGQERLAGGALLLFATNLTGMIFSSGVVFLLQRYGSLERARRGLFVSISLLILLSLPLGFSLQNLLVRENVRRHVSTLIRRRTLTFASTDIRSLQVQVRDYELWIELEIAAPTGSLSKRQVTLVRDFLERELNRPVQLKIQVFPVDVLEAAPPSSRLSD